MADGRNPTMKYEAGASTPVIECASPGSASRIVPEAIGRTSARDQHLPTDAAPSAPSDCTRQAVNMSEIKVRGRAEAEMVQNSTPGRFRAREIERDSGDRSVSSSKQVMK